MEPLSSVDASAITLTDAGRARLLEIADASIRAGLAGARSPLSPDLDSEAPALGQPRGTFVTVTVGGELNGCIGTLEPEPLATAVARLSYQAAFEDPRLPSLTAGDYDRAGIKISVLSPMEPVPASSEDELRRRLRPGIDGLLIESGWHRATFLPAVWDTLPDPRAFLQHLEMKAGLSPGRWPNDMRAYRYTSEEFGTS